MISAVNGDELAETDLISMGDTLAVISAEKKNITKPNPTLGNVNIQGIIYGSQVWVITPSGIVLYDRITDSLSQTISLDAQPVGVYLLIVSRDNKPIHVFKVVKQ